jgi:hypothetical protein
VCKCSTCVRKVTIASGDAHQVQLIQSSAAASQMLACLLLCSCELASTRGRHMQATTLLQWISAANTATNVSETGPTGSKHHVDFQLDRMYYSNTGAWAAMLNKASLSYQSVSYVKLVYQNTVRARNSRGAWPPGRRADCARLAQHCLCVTGALDPASLLEGREQQGGRHARAHGCGACVTSPSCSRAGRLVTAGTRARSRSGGMLPVKCMLSMHECRWRGARRAGTRVRCCRAACMRTRPRGSLQCPRWRKSGGWEAPPPGVSSLYARRTTSSATLTACSCLGRTASMSIWETAWCGLAAACMHACASRAARPDRPRPAGVLHEPRSHAPADAGRASEAGSHRRCALSGNACAPKHPCATLHLAGPRGSRARLCAPRLSPSLCERCACMCRRVRAAPVHACEPNPPLAGVTVFLAAFIMIRPRMYAAAAATAKAVPDSDSESGPRKAAAAAKSASMSGRGAALEAVSAIGTDALGRGEVQCDDVECEAHLVCLERRSASGSASWRNCRSAGQPPAPPRAPGAAQVQHPYRAGGDAATAAVTRDMITQTAPARSLSWSAGASPPPALLWLPPGALCTCCEVCGARATAVERSEPCMRCMRCAAPPDEQYPPLCFGLQPGCSCTGGGASSEGSSSIARMHAALSGRFAATQWLASAYDAEPHKRHEPPEATSASASCRRICALHLCVARGVSCVACTAGDEPRGHCSQMWLHRGNACRWPEVLLTGDPGCAWPACAGGRDTHMVHW